MQSVDGGVVSFTNVAHVRLPACFPPRGSAKRRASETNLLYWRIFATGSVAEVHLALLFALEAHAFRVDARRARLGLLLQFPLEGDQLRDEDLHVVVDDVDLVPLAGEEIEGIALEVR